MKKIEEYLTEEDEALLDELGVEVEAPKTGNHTSVQERIITGFEEVQNFVDLHGRAPGHGENLDIFERLYAVRLDRIRESADSCAFLANIDHQGLLKASNPEDPGSEIQDLDDEELLAELGVETDESSITNLRHVRPSAEKRAAEEVANRVPCKDFDDYKPLFEQVQLELNTGLREIRRFEMKAEIEKGRFFIVGGQKAYVAEKGQVSLNEHGKTDARLRVIFDNGTESNMLMRSLQRALNKDVAGRRVTEPTAGPLFASSNVEGDEASGTIYVLRSKSDLPVISENRDLVHKIGVTNLDVEKRIAGAHLQPTFLLAGVDLVASYELYNISSVKLEALIHRIFSPARLDIEINDRFGKPVSPREWFLVPLSAIDDAVEKIRDGTIMEFRYDPEIASFVSL